ncbi:MAG: ATP-binding cassette domain-containing protein, partial [Gammaproteobacteria bacterium]
CTPSGIMELLRRHDVALEGAEAVVIGRSDLVGKPVAALLLAANATVTIAHSRTRELGGVCARADVLVAEGARVVLSGRSQESLDAACAALDEAEKLFRLVGIPSPRERLSAYPHQLSGGMRQRVMIAMSLALSPDVLIADEPTTALDVTVQAQILALLDELKRETGTAVVLITHDLGVVAEVADDVIVMYGGKVVEQSKVDDLFDKPEMPYTWGLLGS